MLRSLGDCLCDRTGEGMMALDNNSVLESVRTGGRTYNRQRQDLFLAVAELDVLLTEQVAWCTIWLIHIIQGETIAVVARVWCGTLILVIILAIGCEPGPLTPQSRDLL